jgi:hypothetical protein
MSAPPPPHPAPKPRGAVEASPREARLAAALRANLGRRKAQARSRDEPQKPSSPPKRPRD